MLNCSAFPDRAKQDLEHLLNGNELFQFVPYKPFETESPIDHSSSEPETEQIEYDVTDILDRRKFDAERYQWKVKWTDGSTTWEFEECFKSNSGVTDVWQDYEKAHRRIQSNSRSKKHRNLPDHEVHQLGEIDEVIDQKWNQGRQEVLFKVKWVDATQAASWVPKSILEENPDFKTLVGNFSRSARKRRLSCQKPGAKLAKR